MAVKNWTLNENIKSEKSQWYYKNENKRLVRAQKEIQWSKRSKKHIKEHRLDWIYSKAYWNLSLLNTEETKVYFSDTHFMWKLPPWKEPFIELVNIKDLKIFFIIIFWSLHSSSLSLE